MLRVALIVLLLVYVTPIRAAIVTFGGLSERMSQVSYDIAQARYYVHGRINYIFNHATDANWPSLEIYINNKTNEQIESDRSLAKYTTDFIKSLYEQHLTAEKNLILYNLDGFSKAKDQGSYAKQVYANNMLDFKQSQENKSIIYSLYGEYKNAQDPDTREFDLVRSKYGNYYAAMVNNHRDLFCGSTISMQETVKTGDGSNFCSPSKRGSSYNTKDLAYADLKLSTLLDPVAFDEENKDDVAKIAAVDALISNITTPPQLYVNLDQIMAQGFRDSDNARKFANALRREAYLNTARNSFHHSYTDRVSLPLKDPNNSKNKIKKSKKELLEQEFTRRFTDDQWFDEISSSPVTAVWRDIALMEATMMSAEADRARRLERIEILLATMLSHDVSNNVNEVAAITGAGG